MPRPATLAALTTATDAAGGVLVLDAVHDCAFVLRPCQATPLARPQHQQRHRTGHLPC